MSVHMVLSFPFAMASGAGGLFVCFLHLLGRSCKSEFVIGSCVTHSLSLRHAIL